MNALVFPKLNKYSTDQQHASIQQYRETGNAEDLEYLFRSTQGMVYFMAKKYRRMSFTLSPEDLVQTGLLALLEACHQYDPTRGVPFTAMAWRYIQNAMLLEIRRLGSAFSGNPREKRRILQDARAAEAHLMQQGIEPTASRIAKELGVDECLCAHMLGRDPGDQVVMQERSYGPPARDVFAAERVQKALARLKLNDREREVLNRRLLTDDPEKFEHIGQDLGITRQGVHLIEKRILEKLRREIRYVD